MDVLVADQGDAFCVGLFDGCYASGGHCAGDLEQKKNQMKPAVKVIAIMRAHLTDEDAEKAFALLRSVASESPRLSELELMPRRVKLFSLVESNLLVSAVLRDYFDQTPGPAHTDSIDQHPDTLRDRATDSEVRADDRCTEFPAVDLDASFNSYDLLCFDNVLADK